MYFNDDSLLPENMPPLMITAAPYGPMWMPEDCTPEQKLPVTWDEQVQAAVDCYNAGATLLHIHVRDPKTGHISKDFQQYNDQMARLREAVPKMVLQMGGSISFAPAPGVQPVRGQNRPLSQPYGTVTVWLAPDGSSQFHEPASMGPGLLPMPPTQII